ncbi:MAG: UDP-N-acetylmuramate--L-alanine ligase [Candidatus Komeilibacteria bacterium]|nr:UDP-N-acetylmuramate--L-alanine ligase [Candidatus Komeilibacteria bacterium]
MSERLNYKKAFLSGIGGIGLSAMARHLLNHNITVEGSDAVASDITAALEKKGVNVWTQPAADKLTSDFDLFIYSPAIPANHPERIRAAELGIPSYSYPEFLGVLSRQYRTIAISGTHGKSTTTAMVGLIMAEAGLDPTVIVGTQIAQFDHNYRAGQSDWLVVEACEYREHMLQLAPEIAVVTNAEADHLDYYQDLDHIRSSFQKFINSSSTAIINGNDSGLAELRRSSDRTFGLLSDCHWQAKNIQATADGQEFTVQQEGHELGVVTLKIPGQFNILNALAAVAATAKAGVAIDIIIAALAKYNGAWRRFEVVGAVAGVDDTLVISDYAHHPTAVKATIGAARDFYPDRRLVVVFQPHHHNRTKNLFDQFSRSFGGADYLLMSEIYDVKGREESYDQDVSSQLLLQAIRENNPALINSSIYVADAQEVLRQLKAVIRDGDIVLIMGAGDIDDVARKLTT